MQIDGETVEILTDFILGALRSLQMLTATMKLRHLLLGRKVINHLAAAAKALQSCPTVRPHRRQPTRLRPPWDSPGKNTGVGCHFFFQCRKVKSERKVNMTAAAKSLQSCPTLCDPIDSSPPGSALPGILQARTLEWVAISFSNA